MHAIVIILLILAILLVIFTLQNSFELTINVFFWEIANAPFVLVLIGCIIIGYILALFYFYPKILKLKKENSRLKSNIDANEKYHEDHSSEESEEIIANNDPEGIELDEIDDNSFFKD